MNLNFRMHNSNDIDKLVQFWCDNSGWDVIDRKEWERRFYHLPFGNSEIAIAEDKGDGTIMAQFIFIPSQIVTNGRYYKAFRPFAPVMHKNLRKKISIFELSKYILKMYHLASKTFAANGVALLHMMPDPRWARLFHFLKGASVSSFPLYSLYLNKPISITLNENYTFSGISPGDERIDDIWAKTSALHKCLIVRNSFSLPWKLSHGDYKIIGIFKDSHLTGFSASIFKRNDKQWQICDLLFENTGESLLATLQATCLYAINFKAALPDVEKNNLNKIAILATPLLENALSQLRFEKDNYKFHLVTQLLDKNLVTNNIMPENWYVSAND
jgi:hypothetical protein